MKLSFLGDLLWATILSPFFCFGLSGSNNGSLTGLNVGTIFLILALVILSMVLLYFVKKKVRIPADTHTYIHTRTQRRDAEPFVFPTEAPVSAPASDDSDGRTQRQRLHLHKLQGLWVWFKVGVSQGESRTGYERCHPREVILRTCSDDLRKHQFNIAAAEITVASVSKQ